MDWSPILISMKTASLSIFITFFIGLFAAWAVVSLKNETLKVICDGILTLPLVLPPTVAGFFLLYLFGVKRPIGQFFIEYFSVIKLFHCYSKNFTKFINVFRTWVFYFIIKQRIKRCCWNSGKLRQLICSYMIHHTKFINSFYYGFSKSHF